jgi:dihydrofolate reductase
MKTIGIVARSLDNIIGVEVNGKHSLPWKDKTDLNIFKKITMGQFVVMGRKTVESLPKKLEGRKVICLTRNNNYISSKADYVAHSVADVFRIVGETLLFVCGGNEIYSSFSAHMTSCFVSTISIMRNEFDSANYNTGVVEIGDWVEGLEVFYRHVLTWETGFIRLYSGDSEFLYNDTVFLAEVIDNIKESEI